MVRCLTFATALLLFFTLDAAAQWRHTIPAHAIPPGIKSAQVQQKLRQFIHAAYSTRAAQQKTTGAAERLIAASVYDYSSSTTIDSLRFLYNSSNRGSAFDFDEFLGYGDYENQIDFPNSFGMGASVQFDTLQSYSSATAYDNVGIRTYNAAGKVTRFLKKGSDITLYSYDAAGRVAKTTVLDYNGATSTFDSSYRDFYIYNAGGFLIRDSTETWDDMSATWQPDGVYVFAVNAAGLPTQVSLNYYAGPVPVTYFQVAITYNAANKPIRSIEKVLDFSSGIGLQNYYKDTIGYTGNMRTFYNTYGWDTAAKAWYLTSEERRHLNASSLPDSVWSRRDSGVVVYDTAILKLTYNTTGNPVRGRHYEGKQTTPFYEDRWYYAAANVGVTNITILRDITAYPNPATDMLYLKGAADGLYYIHNAAGQLQQSGTLQAASGIPVHMLPPGIYSFSLHDKAGAIHATQFVRQ